MITFKEIVTFGEMVKKSEASEKTYNKLLDTLPEVHFSFIPSMKGDKKKILRAISAKLETLFASSVKSEMSKPLVAVSLPRYTGRLFRGSVVVSVMPCDSESKANEKVADMLLSDSSLTHGTVEGHGITLSIDRMKARGILSKKVAPTVTKSLSYGGGKVWMKASQTRVVVSRG